MNLRKCTFLNKLIEFLFNFLDFLIFKFPAGSLADFQLFIFLQDLLQKPVRKRTKGSSLKGFCKKSEKFGIQVLLILQILEPLVLFLGNYFLFFWKSGS